MNHTHGSEPARAFTPILYRGNYVAKRCYILDPALKTKLVIGLNAFKLPWCAKARTVYLQYQNELFTVNISCQERD
jgi:hypothetical protein